MKSFCALWLPLMFGLTVMGVSKKLRPVLPIGGGLLVLLLFLQMGCGASGSTTPPPLNYTVTVTASSGAIQHSMQVTATVQ